MGFRLGTSGFQALVAVRCRGSSFENISHPFDGFKGVELLLAQNAVDFLFTAA